MKKKKDDNARTVLLVLLWTAVAYCSGILFGGWEHGMAMILIWSIALAAFLLIAKLLGYKELV